MKGDDEIVQRMKRAAEEASRNSYSPYSGFSVGAALLTVGGEIFSACNVENASYGLSVCAERNAVFQAVSKGKTKILAIAIVTDSKRLATPCGACRQVLSEFGREIEIFVFSATGEMLQTTIDKLLPNPFYLEQHIEAGLSPGGS
jgi:cytidine deaminase